MVHTAPDIVEAVSCMLADFDQPPLPFDTVSSFIGKGVPNLVKRTLETAALDGRVDMDAALAVFDRHYRQTNGRFSVMLIRTSPQVFAELARLGYRLACVTNKPEALAAPLLRMTGLAQDIDVAGRRRFDRQHEACTATAVARVPVAGCRREMQRSGGRFARRCQRGARGGRAGVYRALRLWRPGWRDGLAVRCVNRFVRAVA